MSNGGRKKMETKLSLITRRSSEDRKCKFNNLMHLINEDSLRKCFYKLKKNKAPGIDNVTIEMYEQNLEGNVAELMTRMKKMSYRPTAVKRVYIPKDNGKKRPLGIPILEDKLVQMAFTLILEAIYEVNFVDFSYGFRRGRNCHQALKRVDEAIMFNPVNWVVDVDIKGFFDNVNHEKLKQCLELRISDRKFIRYIVRFLKSGIMESGKYYETDKGTPQGGVVSPVLANIYLHYLLDVWFMRDLKPKLTGYVELVRYVDDFVICVEKQQEAHQVLEMIKERFKRAELELSMEKTRIVRFGRGVGGKGNDKPGTFNFLGFTHYCTKSRKGNFKVERKTERKRFARGIRKVKNWLKYNRNRLEIKEIWKMMRWMLTGHYSYYGISGNFVYINHFYDEVKRVLYDWLNRRSQKRSFNWESFHKYLKTYPLPKPRIYHSLYNFPAK